MKSQLTSQKLQLIEVQYCTVEFWRIIFNRRRSVTGFAYQNFLNELDEIAYTLNVSQRYFFVFTDREDHFCIECSNALCVSILEKYKSNIMAILSEDGSHGKDANEDYEKVYALLKELKDCYGDIKNENESFLSYRPEVKVEEVFDGKVLTVLSYFKYQKDPANKVHMNLTHTPWAKLSIRTLTQAFARFANKLPEDQREYNIYLDDGYASWVELVCSPMFAQKLLIMLAEKIKQAMNNGSRDYTFPRTRSLYKKIIKVFDDVYDLKSGYKDDEPKDFIEVD